MDPEKLLSQLVERLERAYGRDLRSVLLFGSGAGNDFDENHSDLNILCLLRDVELDSLEKLEPVANWWRSLGNAAPLLFAEGEMERASDAFPIEFFDIREKHRVLHGDDPTVTITVDRAMHRVQVEHEVRAKLMALRQRYLGIHRDRAAVLRLMVDSLPSFAALFRHVLILAGRPVPENKREVLEAAGRCFGFDPASFLAVLDVREEKRKRSHVDVRPTFEGFYRGITRVCEQVDVLVNQKAEAT